MAGVEQITVEAGEAGMRLDRWFKVHYPGLGFGHLQKLLRSGQIRVDGGRVKADTRVEPGQTVRIPPLDVDKKGEASLTGHSIRNQGDAEVLAKMLLHEDPKVFVFNKPAGLAVQGGSGVTRHLADDPNLSALLEIHAELAREPVIVQKFLSSVTKGVSIPTASMSCKAMSS